MCLQAPSIIHPAVCWVCAAWLLCSSTGSVVCCWSVPASRVLSVWIAPMEQPRHRSSDRPVSRGASPAEGVISVISLTGARTTTDRSRREVSLWCLSQRAPHPPVLRSRSGTDCRTCDRKLRFAVTCVGQQKEPWLLCCRLFRSRSVVDCRTGRRELCSRRLSAIRSATHLSGSAERDPQCYTSVGIG